MIEYRTTMIKTPSVCVCDRCGRRIEDGDADWSERLTVDFVGGYDSVFGDGNRVQLDLCQQCVRDALWAWLRVSPPEQ